jgi:hypothetical protein
MRVISREDLKAAMPGATDEELDAELQRLVDEEIVRDHAEYTRTEDAQREARLAGRLCPCCDKPLPAGWPGPDCADCAELAL